MKMKMTVERLEELAQKEINRKRLITIGNPSFTVYAQTKIEGELIPGVFPKFLGESGKGYVYLIDAKQFLSALTRYRMESLN